MMRAYPSVERRHIVPSQCGLARIGHMGFFRPSSSALWTEVVDWFESTRQFRRLNVVDAPPQI